ncbi:hypothetical protein E4T44_01095 [Aureobasidium sp. EXF-8845]|nr:hypothetical protein E4T44_01095 [Aureobasidium sp. EXF-8845]KAI4857460.1 hypothetical protein E4T45_01053 [Aureobasidium sp. EXF-8846]
MVELNFPETELADVNLFARMQLLGKLCEMALEKRWCMPALSDSNGVYNIATVQIVVDPDSERLAELIQRMLRQHSGAKDVTETRPYQYLHLLIIDHEMIQEHQIEDSRKVVIRILSHLNAIEKFSEALEEIKDFRSGRDIGGKSPRRLQSIFETVLHTIGDQG